MLEIAEDLCREARQAVEAYLRRRRDGSAES